MGLEEWLERERSAGRLDSVGEFTFDWKRAGDLLGRLRLPEPRAYALKLVQWAVTSGARRIEVTVSRNAVRVAHDGPTEAGLHWHVTVALDTLRGLDPMAIHLDAKGRRTTIYPERQESQAPDGLTAVVVDGLPRKWVEFSPLV